MSPEDYWKECISDAAGECELKLTEEQLNTIASHVHIGHNHYGMAFYSPPDSDRASEIEEERRRQYVALERDFDTYRNNAEIAVKRALGQHDGANITIGDFGEVLRHDGRTEQIQ